MTRILTVVALLLYVAALLNPLRYTLLPSFFSEMLAFAALAVAALIWWNRPVRVPAALLGIGLIVLIAPLQYVMGQILYLQTALLPPLYVLAFGMAMLLGVQLGQPSSDSGRRWIFVAIYGAALISVALALAQILGVQARLWILHFTGNRAYANLGQPNHLGSLLLCGIAAGWYLWRTGQLNKYAVGAGQVLLLLGVVITQSRTAWLGLGLMTLILLCYASLSQVRNVVLAGWAGVFVALQLLVPRIQELLATYSQTVAAPIATVSERVSSGYERLAMWNQMLHAILLKPWTGWGWYQTTRAEYAVIHDYHGMEWYTSGHNLILDLLVWCGVPLGMLVASYLGWLLWRGATAISAPVTLAAGMMVGVLTVHALLEYPLYYGYFLILMGVMLGILHAHAKGRVYWVPAPLVQTMLIAQAGIVLWICSAYTHYERLIQTQRITLAGQPAVFDQLTAHQWWLSLPIDHRLTVTEQQAARTVLSHYLTQHNLTKYTIMLIQQGQLTEAQYHLEILSSMYGQSLTLSDLDAAQHRDAVHLDQRAAR